MGCGDRCADRRCAAVSIGTVAIATVVTVATAICITAVVSAVITAIRCVTQQAVEKLISAAVRFRSGLSWIPLRSRSAPGAKHFFNTLLVVLFTLAALSVVGTFVPGWP
jgi:hypothetical protein